MSLFGQKAPNNAFIPSRDAALSVPDEKEFLKQFRNRARALGISENPDDARQLFRSRAQFLDLKLKGQRFDDTSRDDGHLFGAFKLPGHPTQFKLNLGPALFGGFDLGVDATDTDLTQGNPANFINTITDRPATPRDFDEALTVRRRLQRQFGGFGGG